MNIEQINTVLSKAIVSLQDSELEAITEKVGFSVPSPSKFGFQPSWKPKPPSAFGFKPEKVPPAFPKSPKARKTKSVEKWRKGDFTTSASAKSGEPERIPKTGFIKGVWGIAKGGGSWGVYHIPSGFSVPALGARGIKNKPLAMAYVDLMIEKDPSLLKIKDTNKLRNLGFRFFLDTAKEAERSFKEVAARKKAAKSERLGAAIDKLKAAKPVTMGSGRWDKGVFSIGEPGNVAGYVKGAWGVDKRGGGWNITHIPSRMKFLSSVRKKAVATAIVDEIVEQNHRLLYEKDTKILMQDVDILKSSIRKHFPEWTGRV